MKSNRGLRSYFFLSFYLFLLFRFKISERNVYLEVSLASISILSSFWSLRLPHFLALRGGLRLLGVCRLALFSFVSTQDRLLLLLLIDHFVIFQETSVVLALECLLVYSPTIRWSRSASYFQIYSNSIIFFRFLGIEFHRFPNPFVDGEASQHLGINGGWRVGNNNCLLLVLLVDPKIGFFYPRIGFLFVSFFE